MVREINSSKFEPVGRQQVVFQVGTNDHDPNKKWNKQVYNVNSIVNESLTKIQESSGKVTVEEWDTYSNAKDSIEEQSDLIDQHLDRRIELMFMQFICTYRTPFHFEWAEADDQYGQGHKYDLRHPNGKDKITFPTEAAHDSTFPCLIAYPKGEWDKYKNEGGNKPNGFVYLKYSHSYLQHNSTMEMARCVNRADCLIDGTHTDSQLREEAIDLINECACGDFSPRSGMKRFTTLLDKYIKNSSERINKEDPRFLVLEKYQDRLDEVVHGMNDDVRYFDQLIGVKIGEHEREKILRKVVYQKRYRLIQDCEDIESKIARNILDAQNKMLNKNHKMIKYVDERLRYILLEDCNPQFKMTLERIFCTSLDQLRANLDQNEARFRAFEGKNRITSFREAHTEAISSLKRELRYRFHELSSSELDYRSNLFKGLRVDLQGWTQPQFVEEFKKKYRLEAMSTPMVSRIEQRSRAEFEFKDYASPLCQRRKDIDLEKAKKISTTFGIDQGLFLPAIVSSTY